MLNRIASKLEVRQVVYSNSMSAPAIKAEHDAAYNLARSRAMDGKARRRP